MKWQTTLITLAMTIAVLGLMAPNTLYAMNPAAAPVTLLSASTYDGVSAITVAGHGHGSFGFRGDHGGVWHGGGAWRHGGIWYGASPYAYSTPYYGDYYDTYVVPDQSCVRNGYDYVCSF
jgi:hypothetical protein